METVTVRVAAACTGLSAHTLRYYERAGLLATDVIPEIAKIVPAGRTAERDVVTRVDAQTV